MQKLLNEWRKYLTEQEQSGAADPNVALTDKYWNKTDLDKVGLEKLKNIVHKGSHLGRKARRGKQLQPADEFTKRTAAKILFDYYTKLNDTKLASIYRKMAGQESEILKFAAYADKVIDTALVEFEREFQATTGIQGVLHAPPAGLEAKEVPKWAKESPYLYGAVTAAMQLFFGDPVTAALSITMVPGAMQALKQTPKAFRALQALAKNAPKTRAGRAAMAKAKQAKDTLRVNADKIRKEIIIQQERGGLSPAARKAKTEQGNLEAFARMGGHDPEFVDLGSRRVKEGYKQFKGYLQWADDLAKNPAAILKSMRGEASYGVDAMKLVRVVRMHIGDNMVLPPNLAKVFFRIAKSGKSEYITLLKNKTVYKGVGPEFLDLMKLSDRIPKAPGRYKIKVNYTFDPVKNTGKVYRSKYNFDIKSPTSEWTTDIKVAKHYASGGRGTATPSRARGKVKYGDTEVLLKAKSQGNTMLDYEKLKDGIDMQLFRQGEVLSYGKVTVDEIIVIVK